MNTATIVFLAFCTVILGVVAVYLVIAVRQIRDTAEQIEKLTRSLDEAFLPRIEKILEQADADMAELRAFTQSGQRAADSIEHFAGTLREFAEDAQAAAAPGLTAIHGLGQLLRRGVALAEGVKVGVAAVRRLR